MDKFYHSVRLDPANFLLPKAALTALSAVLQGIRVRGERRSINKSSRDLRKCIASALIMQNATYDKLDTLNQYGAAVGAGTVSVQPV